MNYVGTIKVGLWIIDNRATIMVRLKFIGLFNWGWSFGEGANFYSSWGTKNWFLALSGRESSLVQSFSDPSIHPHDSEICDSRLSYPHKWKGNLGKIVKCSPTNNQMVVTIGLLKGVSLPELLFLQGMYTWSISNKLCHYSGGGGRANLLFNLQKI